MNPDFIRANEIVDGWFYTFKYQTTVTGYDDDPLVFCIQPDTRNINNVCCINLHHVPVSERAEFLSFLDALFDIRKTDMRLLMVNKYFIERQLRYLTPAIRYYNRKKIVNLHRIKAKDVGKYIEYEGKIIGKDPKVTVMNKYWGDEYGKAVEGSPSDKEENE